MKNILPESGSMASSSERSGSPDTTVHRGVLIDRIARPMGTPITGPISPSSKGSARAITANPAVFARIEPLDIKRRAIRAHALPREEPGALAASARRVRRENPHSGWPKAPRIAAMPRKVAPPTSMPIPHPAMHACTGTPSAVSAAARGTSLVSAPCARAAAAYPATASCGVTGRAHTASISMAAARELQDAIASAAMATEVAASTITGAMLNVGFRLCAAR